MIARQLLNKALASLNEGGGDQPIDASKSWILIALFPSDVELQPSLHHHTVGGYPGIRRSKHCQSVYLQLSHLVTQVPSPFFWLAEPLCQQEILCVISRSAHHRIESPLLVGNSRLQSGHFCFSCRASTSSSVVHDTLRFGWMCMAFVFGIETSIAASFLDPTDIAVIRSDDCSVSSSIRLTSSAD